MITKCHLNGSEHKGKIISELLSIYFNALFSHKKKIREQRNDQIHKLMRIEEA